MMEASEDEARMLLRAWRHQSWDSDGQLRNYRLRLHHGSLEALTANIFMVAVGLTAVFLVVGGIVIMNIMLASVTERTREIGLRRSLGARKKHILMQFVTESAVLAATGGLIGIVLAYLGGCRGARRNLDSDAHAHERGDSLALRFDGRRPFLWDLSCYACCKTRPDRSTAVGRLRSVDSRLAGSHKTTMAQQHGENLKQAMDTLRAHKLRSVLTVFGVVLGVSVIMLVAALITGFDAQVQENIKQYGADTAFVSRFDQGPHGGRRPKEERERKPLTLEDAAGHPGTLSLREERDCLSDLVGTGPQGSDKRRRSDLH